MLLKKVFEDSVPFDYVFNFSGELKYSQEDAIYQESIVDVSVRCGTEAAKRGVKKFLFVSTAQVYDSGSKPRGESAKLKPWTGIAKAKLKTETELSKISGLNLIIVRPSTVYGPGDTAGLMPRIITAAVYKSLNEKMEFLWDKDLKFNTVHVKDLSRALFHLAEKANAGSIFNLSDQSDTSQGSICSILEKLFGISTGFMGNMKSKLATSVAMSTVAEVANDKHMKPWSDICKAHNISSTPLTPYLDVELLYDNDLAVDGQAILSTGFKYEHPQVTPELVKESIQYQIAKGAFPAGLC